MRSRHPAGFTLIEIAIVLVIVGLIVGGIFAGQHLLKAAEVRGVGNDIGKYNAAVSTFNARYKALPGDMLGTDAQRYGFTTRNATQGQGNQNGFIEGCTTMSTALGCETAVFWIDLTDSQLIYDAFTTLDSVADGNNGPAAAVDTSSKMGNYLPTLRLRDSAFVHVFPQSGRNYWYLGSLTASAGGVGTGGAITVLNSLGGALAGMSPSEAVQLEDKLDDGKPSTGIIRAVSAMTPLTGSLPDQGGTGNAGDCVLEGATAGVIESDEEYYLTNEEHARVLACNLIWRASF